MNQRGFSGELEFLSNFYECSIRYEGLTYDSVEAAFQAAKCADPAQREEFVGLMASEAKKKGQKVSLRSDWEDVKVGIMDQLVRLKFDVHADLRGMLLAVDPEQLVETNNWHDNFFGNCVCPKHKDVKGKNILGKILTDIRSEWIKKEQIDKVLRGQTAVIANYSFDYPSIYLFNSLEAAIQYVRETYKEECRINDEEEREYAGTISDDGRFAKIEEPSSDIEPDISSWEVCEYMEPIGTRHEIHDIKNLV